jgi:DNA-binding PadR family transcriptional regulator
VLYATRIMGAARDVQATPMHSPVNWALLGLVIERPSYAYELAQRFERTYEGALSLSSVSHVYTALATLKSRALIEEIPGVREGRRPRRFTATPKGLRDYREWLLGQLSEDRRRQRLFVLQLAALTRDPHEALEIIAEYERTCLEEARSAPLGNAQGVASVGGTELAARLVAEEHRLAVGAKLAWVQYARRELSGLANDQMASERGTDPSR